MRTAAISAMLTVFACGSALAGPLATDPNAWTWMGTTWRGSVSVESLQDDLKAEVDYCVYCWTEYPGTDYTPTPGEFVYAYQVYVTGTGPVMKFSVGMFEGNEANNIGDDPGVGEAGGHVPDSWFFTGGPLSANAANWEWADTGPLLTHSDALVCSSTKPPMW
jgi:hypothetical protein